MNRTWLMKAKVLIGLFTAVGCAFPQAYTISAKPGVLSYLEGDISMNGAPVAASSLRSMFMGANDTLTTAAGKAEVLLTPGVFLRVGDSSTVRMISPSLVNMQIEMISGEVLVEVDQIMPGSTIAVISHGSSTDLLKTGLYRFTAVNEPTVGVLAGRAEVHFGAKQVELGKNKQALLTEELTVSKLDLSQADELYAWSNVRSQYDAAVSYQGAKSVYDAGGYGFNSGYQSSGLYWNNPYNSWMWMPGNAAYYSPFGWGFYGPGLVAYAPIVGYGYGGYGGGYFPIRHPRPGTGTTIATTPPVVPINPKHPGVTSFTATSPAAYASIRTQAQQSFQSSGHEFKTFNGGSAAAFSSGRTYSNAHAVAHAAAASPASGSSGGGGGSSGGGGWAGSSAAASSGISSVSSHSASSGGGGHSGGGSSGGGGHR